VRIDWVLLALVGALALVLSSLYAAMLSTRTGKAVCERRTYWTVVGGHLLMALTMCFVSSPVAGLWLVWSVLCGTPLVIRSLGQEWRLEASRDEARRAAIRGALRGQQSVEVGSEASCNSCSGNGHEPSGAGV